MNVRVIPRTVLRGYLKVVRTPLNSAIGLLPGDGTGARPTAQLAVDRADARVRAVAGTLLGDPVLREDGERRRLATHERERAVRVHDRAEQTSEHADARLQEREERAHQERRQARETTAERRRQAEARAQKEKQQAVKAESRRREAARRAAAQREQAIDERAPREQLEALEAKSDALRARERELAARDEARRLAGAASRVKASRKADS